MPKTARFHWQLHYGDRFLNEPVSEASIRIGDRGATELRVLDVTWTPVVRVELGDGFGPVFYRFRSMAPGDNGTRLDGTVFGRVRQNGSEREGTLWFITPGGQVHSCPPQAVNLTEIDKQYEYFFGH